MGINFIILFLMIAITSFFVASEFALVKDQTFKIRATRKGKRKKCQASSSCYTSFR